MTESKSEIKAATVHELGVKFDDMLDTAKHEVSKSNGAKDALLLASKKVSELSSHIDKDMDEGTLSDISDPLSVAKTIKKYVQRAVGILESGATSAENHRLVMYGKVQALEQMISNMKKIHDMELLKAQNKHEAERSDDGLNDQRSRPVGVAPGKTLKERRLEKGQYSSELPRTGEKAKSKSKSKQLVKSNGSNAR